MRSMSFNFQAFKKLRQRQRDVLVATVPEEGIEEKTEIMVEIHLEIVTEREGGEDSHKSVASSHKRRALLSPHI
jgi:hypothetical protein